MRVGGSGFIAAHVLNTLLARGHSVVTTVRSLAKANAIRQLYPHVSRDRLGVAIVPDIAQADGTEISYLPSPSQHMEIFEYLI